MTLDHGLHVDLVKYWIRTAALLAAPIAPHFAEHIWTSVLQQPSSIQLARWPKTSGAVDRSRTEAAVYMRGTVKTIRDAELGLLKKLAKGKGVASYDPKKPKAVRVYVASAFPAWQETCVQAVRESYAADAERVDDAKVREVLTAKGLIKDKRAMPFVQMFKVGYPWTNANPTS